MDREIVFIDTSIYIAENFFSPNNRINSLQELAEKGLISLVSTEITQNEVLRHFKDNVSSALGNVKNNKVWACFDDTRKLLYRDTKKQLLKRCEEIFKKFNEKSKVYTIEYKYCDDVKPIFERYFNEEKPFNGGKKKYEFPDAFALHILERYCIHNSIKQIIVLSNDKDMKEYESKYLKPIDYKEYITNKLAEANTIDRIAQTIKKEQERICSLIKTKLEEELYDGRNYSGLFNTEDLPEVEIEKCQVEIDDDYSIIFKDKTTFLIELHFCSRCEVKCTYFNLDYATYDREDEIWYGGEWETEILTGDERFNIIVSLDDNNDYLHIEQFEVADAIPNFRHSWN